MGIKYGGKKAPEEKKPYVPPMQGSSDASKGMRPTQRPLMLTNGSDAPGAASAHARAKSKGEEYQSSAMRVSWFLIWLENCLFILILFAEIKSF